MANSMLTQKQFLGSVLITVILLSFTHCSSAQKTQDQASFELGPVSYQKWVAGVQGGGSGINVFIPVISNKNKVIFDSLYFRGYQTKIEKNNLEYVAYIKTELNRRKDLIMSNKTYEEFGNVAPLKETDFPFSLADNECVISYIENKTIKYLKIPNLLEKPKEEYPSTPPKQP